MSFTDLEIYIVPCIASFLKYSENVKRTHDPIVKDQKLFYYKIVRSYNQELV